MKYVVTPLFNVEEDEQGHLAIFSRFPDGYFPGDALTLSKLDRFACGIEVEAGTKHEAMNYIWTLMNSDDRPNGRLERSLSVGDVLVLDWKMGGSTLREAYAVASVGFLPTPTPQFQTAA